MTQQLIVAAYNGNVGEVRRLMERGRINPNLRDTVARPNYGWSSLHWACKRGHFGVIRYLIEEANADANIVDNFGWTGLHIACREGVDLSVVQYLVSVAGLNVNAETHFGNTPLHYACYCGHLKNIQYLIEQQKANLEVENMRGETPLYWSFLGSEEAAARYLLPKIASVDKQFLSVLWIYNFSWDIKEMVLKKYAVGQQQARDLANFPIQTILGFPLRKEGAVKDCIKHYPRSTLTYFDNQGRLAIHIALTSPNVTVKSPSIVTLLLDREPRSAVARDPTTGFFPFETAAALLTSSDEVCWLNVIFKLFRANPEPLLRARGLCGPINVGSIVRVQNKKQKTSRC